MRRWFSLILLLIAIILGGLLGTLNPSPVSIDLLFRQFELTLGLALSIALALGLFLGATALWLFRVLPLRARLKRLQKQLTQSRSSVTGKNSAPASITTTPPTTGNTALPHQP